jgi:hypothetical protein
MVAYAFYVIYFDDCVRFFDLSEIYDILNGPDKILLLSADTRKRDEIAQKHAKVGISHKLL